ncbi:phage/plasmid primase, P4 family [Alcaligenes faecalis]|uniref:phage/plasmid primase, P4 family n=1 Tax=Alcaligenes faecalis TaxID=511 RepID=UPI003F7C2AA8
MTNQNKTATRDMVAAEDYIHSSASPYYTLEYSVGRGVKDVHPERRGVLTFAAFADAVLSREDRAVDPATAAEKRALPWIACPFNGTRKAENALPWPVLVLDVDQCAKDAVKPLAAFLRGLAPMFGWTTASHAPEAPRFRVCLHLSRAITPDEGKAVAAWIERRWQADHPEWSGQVQFDPSQQQAGQIAFLPTESAQPLPLKNADAPPLDVGTVQAVPTSPATSVGGQGLVDGGVDLADFVGRPETPDAIAEVKRALSRIDPDLPRKDWLRVLMAIKAHVWACGEELARSWSEQGSKFDASTWGRDWHSLRVGGAVTPATLYWLAGHDPDVCAEAGTDMGAACRFVAWLAGRVRYEVPAKTWLTWRGTYWHPGLAPVEALLAEFTQQWIAQVAGARTDFDLKAARRLLRRSVARDVIDSTRVLLYDLSADETCMEADPWVLAVLNGQVNLRTGALEAGSPGAGQTRRAGVAYHPGAKAHEWERFVRDIFTVSGTPQSHLEHYLQRWCGYILTGSVQEEKMLCVFGPGANGKSVLANVINHVMGSYAQQADVSLIAPKVSSATSPDLAVTRGARLVSVNESDTTATLSDQRVKVLVSTERISARPLHAPPFEFNPTAKLFFRSNHRPKVRDNSPGMWRRLAVLSLLRRFDDEGLADHTLESRLKREAPGILAWMVRGCLEWQRQGLAAPESVKAESEAYRSDQDVMLSWMTDRIARYAGGTSRAEVFANFKAYSGDRSVTRQAFYEGLRARGVQEMRGSKGEWLFKVTLHGF